MMEKYIWCGWKILDIQLGRRNLSLIQIIAVTEKYRPIYENKQKRIH